MTASSFASQLRPHVERLGAPACADLCGVTRQTINLWLRGQGNPNAATQAGALLLLAGQGARPRRRRK